MSVCANCGGTMAVTGVVCGADSSSTSRCQTCRRVEETRLGGTYVRFPGRKVGREEFAAAIRQQAFQPTDPDDVAKYPGGIVHSLLGGIGADWSVEGLVLALDLAETVEWIPAPISGHQLRVVMKADDGRALDYRFDLKKPTADPPHVEGMSAEPPVVVDDPPQPTRDAPVRLSGVDVEISTSRWSVTTKVTTASGEVLTYVASADSALTERSGIWFGSEAEYLEAL